MVVRTDGKRTISEPEPVGVVAGVVEASELILDMRRDFRRMESAVRVLVSADIRLLLIENFDRILGQSGEFGGSKFYRTLYFMGIEVVECDLLHGLEYSFVRGR